MRLISTEKDKTSPGNRGFFVGVAKGNTEDMKKTGPCCGKAFRAKYLNWVGLDPPFNPYVSEITLW